MAELVLKHTKVFSRNLEALENPAIRIISNQGGSRSSKTISIAQIVIYICMKFQNKVISICRSTMPALRATVMRDFFELLNEYKLYSELNHDKTNNTYSLNGNLIEFFSLDDEEKVKGRKRNYLWINEANGTTYEIFKQLLMRTSDKIFLDYNPSELESWIYDEVNTRDEAVLLISTYKDNPFLPKPLIDEIERYMSADPAYYEIYGKGLPADLSKGRIFLRQYYEEYYELPADIKSVIYTDPNLSKKGKGDTSAIIHLGYSANTDNYYILDAVCRSFSDSNSLLDTIYNMKTGRTQALGMDGNVNQESTWTNNVKNWSKITQSPFPVIQYVNYKVDDLSKNAQILWNQKKILFPAGFKEQQCNKTFCAQLFTFKGKWANLPDDAPDSLICSIEFINNRRWNRLPAQPTTQPVIPSFKY